MSVCLRERPLLPTRPPSTGVSGNSPSNEPGGLLWAIMLGLILTMVVIAFALGCPAQRQTFEAVPYPRFAPVSDTVSEVFPVGTSDGF